MKRVFLYVALFLSLAGASFADTLAINTAGVDSGDCTGSDCLTLTYALSQASSGDLILIDDGTYYESQLVIPAGVSVRGENYDKTSVILRPITTDTSQPFVDLSSVSPGTLGNQSISYLTIDGRGPTYYFTHGIRILNRDSVEISYCTIEDFYGAQTWVTATGIGGGSYGIHATSDSSYSYPKSEWWNYTNASLDRVNWPSTLLSGLNIHHNYMDDCGDGTTDRVMAPAVYGWAWQNFVFNSNTVDVSHSETQVFLSTSALFYNGSISYNDVVGRSEGYISGSSGNRALYLFELWNIYDVDIIGNTLTYGGMSTTVGQNGLWEKNYVNRGSSTAPVGYAIEANLFYNSVIRYNYLRGNGSSGNHASIHVGSDSNHAGRAYNMLAYTYSNIVIDHYTHGIQSTISAVASPAQTLVSYMVNNIIDGNGIAGGGYSGIDNDIVTGNNYTAYIVNNIVTNQTGTGVRLTGGWSGSVTADHCCIEENGTDVSNVSETNQITTEPTYTNYAGKDFTLVEGSSAINSGVDAGSPYNTVLSPTTDWTGGSNGSGGTIPNVVLVSQDSYDEWEIGPYVYAPTGSAPNTGSHSFSGIINGTFR